MSNTPHDKSRQHQDATAHPQRSAGAGLWGSVVLVVAIALVAGVAVSRDMRGVHQPAPLHALERAHPARVFAPRLSITTEYRACTPHPARNGGSVQEEACSGEDEEAPAAAAQLADATESANPDTLQASALAELVWGERSEPSLNRIISRLEEASLLTEHPVSVLVDLSAASLLRAEKTQSSRDLVAALEYAGRALVREPRNQAALFNFALALQSLGIDHEAGKAWSAYLRVDSSSNWAKEAARRKQALSRLVTLPNPPALNASTAEVAAFAAADPQTARLMGMDSLLGEWGDAMLRGKVLQAAANLALAERLGNALERQGGDRSLADEVRAIHAAALNSEATRRLARAHRAYAIGARHWLAGDWSVGKDSFDVVLRLRPASPILLKAAELFATGGLVYEKKFDDAEQGFRRLLVRIDSTRNPALAAKTRWALGTTLLRASRPVEAEREYYLAASTFTRLGEIEYAATVLNYYGEAAYVQGDTIKGYAAAHRAVTLLRVYPHSVGLHNTLLRLARSATLDGLGAAAVPIQDEDVTVGLRSTSDVAPVEALIARAQIRALSGDSVTPSWDLARAVRLFDLLPPGPGRDELAAEFNLLAPDQSGREATGPGMSVDSAVSNFDKNVVLFVPALLTRADRRLASRDLRGAVADLDSATAIIRGLSDKLPSAALRGAVMEVARSRFDQLVMLYVDRRDIGGALDVLERGRLSFATARRRAASAGREGVAVHRGETVVEYALINDTLLTWTISDSAMRLMSRPLRRADFVRTVERLSDALEGPGDPAAVPPELARLYDWLIRPAQVRGFLGAPGGPLVIVADGEISRVPFTALLDRTRNRYLLQDHTLRFAASLVDAAQPPTASQPGPALLVGNPTFDREANPELDPLAGATAEVESLRRLYPGSTVLADSAATRRAFTAAARGASVIHYAGHAVFDDTRPERSYLVLVGRGETGHLTAAAVDSLDLRGTRLVVLSACQTLRSRDGRSGGFAGLSGALLDAGVGGVVGSVWNVNDTLALPLMLAFHQAYRRRPDNPAEALRQAQLAMLGSREPARRSPRAWAGYRYVGR